MFHPIHPHRPTRHLPGPVELICQRARENLVDHRGFARPGHPGHAHQHAQGNVHINALQVIFPGPHHREFPIRVDGAPLVRHPQLPAARKVRAGERLLALPYPGWFPLVHHFPTVFAGLRPNVDQPVCRLDGVFIVLHHDQRVTNVPQPFQGGDEPLVIPLVQPNGWFVEHIEHPRQTRADLGGEPNPLRFPTGQGPGRPVERQIGEPHIN